MEVTGSLKDFTYRSILASSSLPEIRFDERWIIEEAKKLGLDYSAFLVVDKVSRYSSLLPNHILQVRKVMDMVSRLLSRKSELTIIDATSHIGVDSIIILSQFGHSRVFSIEIDPLVFRLLQKNCENYRTINPSGNPEVTFYPRFGSCLRELTILPDADVLYFDPPWGGTDYTSNQKMILYLGSFPVSKVIGVYLQSSPSTIVVCKQPRNYDSQEFNETLNGYSIERYEIKKKTDVSYYLLVVRSSKPSNRSLFKFEDKESSSRFQKFISKMTPSSVYNKVYEALIGDENDLEKVRTTRELLGPPPEKNANQGRASSRVKQITKLYPVKKNPRYLDVGCSEGSITLALAEAWGASEVAACDISQQAGVAFEGAPIKVDFRINTATSIPFEDSRVDVVTLNMCAHHFTHTEEMIKEVSRVLAPRGILILREHGNPAHSQFYDAVHCLYETLFGSESTPEEWFASYVPGKYAHYHPQEWWVQTFTSLGFKLVKTSDTGDYVDAFYAVFSKD
jgi:ubiquinone/menaquinone biosynthesis C-methylase UbiE